MDVSQLVRHLAAHAPAFAKRLADARLEPSALRTFRDLDALPVHRKSDLIAQQATAPPFGGLLAGSVADLKGVYQSPGPIYTPEPARPDAWRWAQALSAAGFGDGQIVLNAFSYHLSPAGVMFHEGLVAVGCTVLPGGVGNQEAQVKALHATGATGYVGLPSYLKALLEKAEQMQLPLRLERAFVAAEPLPPSLRNHLESRGVQVRQGYGTAETGNLGYECDELNGWHIPDDVTVQICDLTTGREVPDGEPGEVVVTSHSDHYALVRFGVGDLSFIDRTPCPCGRTSARLMGWQGRVDAAVKVRGLFVHPRQLGQLVSGHPQVARWQAVVKRSEHRDTLVLRIVTDQPDIADKLAARAPDVLKLKLKVEVVSAAQLSADAPALVDERSWE